MKKIITLTLALLMCISFGVIASAYEYNGYVNAVVEKTEKMFYADSLDEAVALAGENGASEIIIATKTENDTSVSLTTAAVKSLSDAGMSLSLISPDTEARFSNALLAEIASCASEGFLFTCKKDEKGYNVHFSIDGKQEKSVFENAAEVYINTGISDANYVQTTGDADVSANLDGSRISLKHKGGKVLCELMLKKAPVFTDMKHVQWAQADVEYVTLNGLFLGTTDTTFSPNGLMKRCMVTTVLSRLGRANTNAPIGEYPYTDVARDAWYARGVAWAYENEVIKSSDKFRPNDNVLRIELIEMLYNYAKKLGVAEINEEKIIAFEDTADITDSELVNAINYCTSAGIINGYKSTKNTDVLRPNNTARRGEVAAMVRRFVNAISKGENDMNTDSTYAQFINARGDLSNTYKKLTEDKKLTVSYFGGSITAGFGATDAEKTSWRGLTYSYLKEKFPEAEIIQNSVSQGGSGSHLGAFRVGLDVIEQGTDLLFVEFAMNDYYSKSDANGTTGMYMESIIRQVREALPTCDIVVVYTTDSGKASSGYANMHKSAKDQEAVCELHGIPSIDVGRAVGYDMIKTGNQSGVYFKDGVHPLDPGYKVYADTVIAYLENYLLGRASLTYGQAAAHPLADEYISDESAKFEPEYVVIDNLDIFDEIKGFTLVPDGKFSNSTRSKGYIYPSENDNSFTYTFEGTGLDMYLNFAGGGYFIEYSIDGGDPVKKSITDTNHPFMLVRGLENGKHTITYSYKGESGNGGTHNERKICALMVTKEKN